ncbi:MAG TPA: diaminopimelate decarboxylase [Candidatus Borkfalkia faecipullorum]|uniref:Diaminopimelate decarboxylase n=1 Tax=Candidatus Borkfalkia faecipullorum TaxID=2838510 RepID=A0A9D1V8T1_9FIRM|nr:diaminopimelate decarboxylase [Candidatus Borkfalkia faecipullorum]
MNTRKTLRVNEQGHLEIGGADAVALAKSFGTPLYVMDEQYIRDMCSVYRDAIREEYDGNGLVLYASKAFSCLAIYKIADSEHIGVDAVSAGELYTAFKAGFPAEKIYLHGNNKLPYELEFALDHKVGTIVVDAYSELDMIDQMCAERGMVQNILLRINPGVEAHTHRFIQTAKTDSKFGFSVADGTAEKITQYALTKKHVHLAGYHCHIGSQIFEKQSFLLAVDKMMAFIAEIGKKYSFETEVLNLGGGYGIWYTDEDAKFSCADYADYLKAIIRELKAKSQEYGVRSPFLVVEPGRSIVGEAGVTLYTVGAIKEIPGIKKYVAVDGGMFDNPRYALYQAKYTAILANRAAEKPTEVVSVAGKCCESGDLVCADVSLPKAESGDILAVLSTGAYNYSMASNYNRNFIPPVVLVKDGKAEYIVKPQTFEDLVRNDVIPDRLK